MCGKKTLKNQQCWLRDVRCGEVCGKMLKCGSHHCQKPCHRLGECEDAHGQQCKQPCGKLKSVCGHPDLEYTCHAPFTCKEDKPCQSKIFITCDCQAQKKEEKCGASKNTEGNSKKKLSCNDECARLERNRKIALALNIDQSQHVDGGDHIPYSTDTLNLYAENVKWAQAQEGEFRLFASSPEEKRLRFKPMQSQQRAFVHALAEDFGFDSESMDPEPHRHVMIWKTPRFVSAPNKTVGDALRIRKAQRSITGSANVSDNESTKKSNTKRPANEPFNAYVLLNPKFGLTIDELQSAINTVLHSGASLMFNVDFLPSEEVVLKAVTDSVSGQELQQYLQNIKSSLVSAITGKGYGSLELCTVDSSLNILRRESDSGPGDGWSKVAAKKAAPKITVSSEGSKGKNAFSALGDGKVTFARKKPEQPKAKKEAVVEDWEAAEVAEEEREKGLSGASEDEGAASRPSTSGGPQDGI
jgi:transcriptional repressor NF-X1